MALRSIPAEEVKGQNVSWFSAASLFQEIHYEHRSWQAACDSDG